MRSSSPTSATSAIDRDVAEAPERPLELLLDLEERELGALDEEDAGRAEARHLARQLRSDRAARSRDDDGLAVQEFAHELLVELDRTPVEQILGLHVPDPGHLHVPLEDLREAGNDPDLHGNLLADLDQPQDLGTCDLRDRDDDLLDPEVPDESEVASWSRGRAGRG